MVISLADSLVTKRNISELFRFQCWVLLPNLFGNNSWWITSPFSRRKKVSNQTKSNPLDLHKMFGKNIPHGCPRKVGSMVRINGLYPPDYEVYWGFNQLMLTIDPNFHHPSGGLPRFSSDKLELCSARPGAPGDSTGAKSPVTHL